MRKPVLILSALSIVFAFPAVAGPGHDHGSAGDSAGGPLSEIVLSDAMIRNLGIATSVAEKRDISKTVDLAANVDYLPEKQAIVGASAEGAIARILVRTGQKVKKGDAVIVFQPRLVGNPPVTLVAPMEGYVTEQNVVIGQSVTPDQSLLKIADLSEVLVRGQAYEDAAPSVFKVGNPVIVTAASYPDEKFEGEIQRADATFRPASRVREIWAIIDNPEGKLLANMQARLSIRSGELSPAIIVPQRAVLGESGHYFVYVRDRDHFYRRDVTLGEKYGPLRQIIEGVSQGEHVVTVGNYQLQFVTASIQHDDKAQEGNGQDDYQNSDAHDGQDHRHDHDHTH